MHYPSRSGWAGGALRTATDRIRRRRSIGSTIVSSALGAAALLALAPSSAAVPPQVSGLAPTGPTLPYPVMFCTQVPVPGDFTSIGTTFGNHRADVKLTGRGGDLWMRYEDGSLKNLTRAAGFGTDGFQGSNSIAVRDPAVHWSGDRALFSMAIGAPSKQYEFTYHLWQIYEIVGLGKNDTPYVSRVPNQPEGVNNVTPFYGTNGRILFTSGRSHNGEDHLHPQRDEYEMVPTVSGIWSLDPGTGDLDMITTSPSGDFTPFIDSYGRVVFTRWDHLQRDQQGITDPTVPNPIITAFDWSDESASAQPTFQAVDIFPEALSGSVEETLTPGINGHTFNHFFPWMVNEDGTGLLTLNHIGRHELHAYFESTFFVDLALENFVYNLNGAPNQQRIQNFFHIAEDPTEPGRYFGTNAPEFFTHSGGQLISMNAPEGLSADQSRVTHETSPSTADYTDEPESDHSGLYRDPLPLSNGTLVAVHTANTDRDYNVGTIANPKSTYEFRMRTIEKVGAYRQADKYLTPGIHADISWWNPNTLVQFSGNLWEFSPVEVRPLPVPNKPAPELEAPEAAAFAAAGVDPNVFRVWLYQRGLALVVTRDITTRDDADKQQPFNLRVAGTGHQTIGTPGKVYDVAALQFLRGDYIRGSGGQAFPDDGRRALARTMPEFYDYNPSTGVGPESSARVASDGSVAAIVPARRSLTWQLTDGAGSSVVRERYWLSFQPGEVRSCVSCHGANEKVQTGGPPPTNTPEALVDLLEHWKTLPPDFPELGPAGAGSVGAKEGGPFDVLTINGSSGGADRRVDVLIGAPFTVELKKPPTHPQPAAYILWGHLGAPSPVIAFESPLGPMTFAPPPFQSLFSYDFVFASSFGSPLAPIVPTPYSLTLPAGFPGPLVMTLQGVVEDASNVPYGVSTTNGVILRVW